MTPQLKASFFIIDQNLTKSDITELSEFVRSQHNQWFEFIMLSATADNNSLPTPIYFVAPKQSGQAIIEAGGEWIVFIHLRELLEHYTYFTENFMTVKHGLAAVPYAPINRFTRLVGLRKLSAAPFIAYKKYFIANSPQAQTAHFSPNDRLKLVKSADQSSALLLIKELGWVANKSSVVLPKKAVFFRPYFKISWRLLKYAIRGGVRALLYSLTYLKALVRRLRNKKLTYKPDIPVFINCRDRLKPLKELIAWLDAEGLNNIILIDNNSSYPPLLKYLEKSPYKVLKLRSNVGHNAPWLSGAINLYAAGEPYIVTDPDVIPVPESHGAVKEFVRLLNRYPWYRKVGFGLKIDDLPDHYDLKQTVINWESQFWEKEKEEGVFVAEIDTTFALYRPGTPYILQPALRTGGQFIARHEPWYIDSSNIDDEVIYYRSHANKDIGSWGVKEGDLASYYLDFEAK